MVAEQERGWVWRTTAPLEGKILADIITAQFPSGGCAVVRRVDWIEFLQFQADKFEQMLATWPEGQVFSRVAELRWRHVENRFEVLILTEQPTPPDGFNTADNSPFRVAEPSLHERHGFFLWGTKFHNDQWWETRIPRGLSYPIPMEAASKQPLPRLAYKFYLHKATVRWVRLVDLKEDTFHARD